MKPHLILYQLDKITGDILQMPRYEYVWHYTSIKTLEHALIRNTITTPEKIITWGFDCLFATRTSFLNDGMELEYGRQLASAFLAGKPDSVAKRLFHDALDGSKGFETYVTCLSAEGDQLEQWRAYGDDGRGICLAFALEQIACSHPSGWVLYQEEHQLALIEILYGLIEDYLSELEPCEEYSLTLPKMVLTAIALIKDPAFASEREFRMIKVVTNPQVRPGFVSHHCEFRHQGNRVIPYLRLRPTATKFQPGWGILRAVTGPGHLEHEWRAISEYLDLLTGTITPASHSRIPYIPR